MRYILVMFSMSFVLYGGVFDFSYIKKAKEAYKSKEYKKAEDNYKKLDSDEARYNLANSLYKQKRYKDALEVYNSIDDENLRFQTLYNKGNTLAHLGKIKEAIKSYQEALKIKEDKDAKANIELLKKQQQKKKKQDNRNKKDNKQKNQNSSKKESKNNKNKNQKKGENKNEKKKNKDKQKDIKKQQQKEKGQKEQKTKIEKPTQKQPPISNMEERKWHKMLESRGINTLMLPIKKGGNDDKTKPW